MFTGGVPWEEVPAYTDAGDVFAMPCRTRLLGLEPEAWGIVFLEAQACGLPVVVGDSGGAPETLVGPGAGGDRGTGEVAEAVLHFLDSRARGRRRLRWTDSRGHLRSGARGDPGDLADGPTSRCCPCALATELQVFWNRPEVLRPKNATADDDDDGDQGDEDRVLHGRGANLGPA